MVPALHEELLERVGGDELGVRQLGVVQHESRSVSAAETSAFYDGKSLRNCEIRRRVFNVNSVFLIMHKLLHIRILVLQQFYSTLYNPRLSYLSVHGVMKFDEQI